MLHHAGFLKAVNEMLIGWCAPRCGPHSAALLPRRSRSPPELLAGRRDRPKPGPPTRN